MRFGEIKNVPLNFEWPLYKMWKGYINPYPQAITCPLCDGTGFNSATLSIYKEHYSDWRTNNTYKGWVGAITEDEALELSKGEYFMNFKGGELLDPTLAGINNWLNAGGKFDLSESFTIIKTRAKRLGIFGDCNECSGKGSVYKDAALGLLSENWKASEPPTGAGFQLWRDDESAPITPVFSSLPDVAAWYSNNETKFHYTPSKWLEIFEQQQHGDCIIIDPFIMIGILLPS